MKNVISSFLKSGTGVVLSALFGLLLLRMVSFDLGVEGIAKFGIYRQFIQFCAVFLSWGNGFSIIENFAKAKDKQEFTSASFRYFVLITIFFSALIIPFSSTLTSILFNDTTSTSLILCSPLVFIGLSQFNFFRSILVAQKHLLVSGVLQAIPFLFMVVFFYFFKNLSDFFILSYLTSAVASYCVWKALSDEEIYLTGPFKRLPEFEKTSLATIITGAVGFFCPLIVKSISVHYLGMETTGILEIELSLVNYFTLAIIAGLGTFYLGTVSAHPDDIHFREKVFKLLVLLTAVGLGILTLLQNTFIGILFGTKLLSHGPDISLFAIAELLRSINWFFIFTFIGLGLRKTYITFDTISNFFYILASFVLILYLPTKQSIQIGYVSFQFLYMVLNLFFCYKSKILNPKSTIKVILGSLIILLPLILARLS